MDPTVDIVKYFYEEPVALETLTPELEPDARRRAGPSMPLEALLNAPCYYRGYLAGTDLDRLRIGATALADPEAAFGPLREAVGEGIWTRRTEAGDAAILQAGAAGPVLREPAGTVVLALADAAVDPALLAGVVETERRYGLPGLRRLLEDARVVLFPEPAHHGYDWSLFATEPVRERLAAAFRRHPHPDARRFVLPYQQARSESTFYFEQYDLSKYATHEIR